MGKYYCDYCDTFLTHDSPSVRKTHNNGRKHKENVRFYYQKWVEEQAQTLIDKQGGAAIPPPAMVPPPMAGNMPLMRPPMPMMPPAGMGPPPMGMMRPGMPPPMPMPGKRW